jgi:hypothetical protein
MATEAPVNGVSTTLASAITSTSQTTCSLTSATGFTNAQYHCLITDNTNYEIVEATGISGTTLTIARATESWGGSATAYTFASGSTITVVMTVASLVGLIQATMLSGNVNEYELTDTNPHAILSYTPGSASNYQIGIYFRVVTGSTTVTITVTWTDTTGAQTLTLLNAVSEAVGSYSLVSFLVHSVASDAIAVNFTAGTANQVYASASILQA